ncbi:hypothetical protein CIL05_20570 [Virgibacillus profundi]|uniref:Aminoglycoside phosphotransferase domain-containing protein n=1 Tax=Virgibacillus profundi TaxID=2024555 RepID=A0A2A2I8T1_9BACI|nr:phosphotransferase [Virgibacillus profundi]PAV27694.1 hypothetical protein CIL05_20570 [Virgibacillus profundi]PXY51849.1 hypothetical protein CIT14_20790 [Virgibacillus profundi]
MDSIKKVLQAYSIYPHTIDKITDRIYQVSDGQSDYALKRSKLSMDKLTNWENSYQLAFSHNLSSVLPVYLTNDGNLYKNSENDIFYLTPWIDNMDTNINKQTMEQFYRNIGKIHAKTKQEQMIQTEALKRNFYTYMKYCEDTLIHLLDFVEQFEKNRYMSPFELLVCTQFRELEYGLKEINKRIEQFIDLEEEKITWNYSLCHGDLDFSHMLTSNQSYLINFENATYESAAMDLAIFFKNEVADYDSDTELFIDLFSLYMDANKLTTNELQLLVIHLLNPAEYFSIVQGYVNGNDQDSMIENVIQLQHVYRKFLFGIQLSSHIENEYETITFDDPES